MEDSTFEIILEKNYKTLDFLQEFHHEIQENILKISISKKKNLNQIFELLNKNNI